MIMIVAPDLGATDQQGAVMQTALLVIGWDVVASSG